MLFLYGGYGCGNHGDDLICKGALMIYPNSNVFAHYTCPNIYIDENNVYIVNEKSELVIDVLNKNKDRKPKLVFAGGGLFWSREHILTMYEITAFCFENKIPVTMERVGLHGAQYYPEKSLGLLEMMSYISVRDRSSLDLILGMGLNINIPVHINHCFTILIPKLICIREETPICYINLNLWLSNAKDSTVFLIKKLISKFTNIKFKYLIQTCHINKEHSEEKYIELLSPFIDIVVPETSEEYYNTFKNASYVISSGYHSAFLPSINGIPTFQIAFGVDNQTKYVAVAKELKLDYYVQSVYQTFNTDKIFHRICKFIKNKL